MLLHVAASDHQTLPATTPLVLRNSSQGSIGPRYLSPHYRLHPAGKALLVVHLRTMPKLGPFNSPGNWAGKVLTLRLTDGTDHACEIVDLPFFDPDKNIVRGIDRTLPE